MQSSSDFTALIPMLLPRIPFFLICVGGLVIAMMQMKTHPKPALLVLLASLALLGGFLTSVGSNVLVLQRAHGGSAAELGVVLSVLGMVQAVLSAAGYALLIWAAFADRAPATQPQRAV